MSSTSYLSVAILADSDSLDLADLSERIANTGASMVESRLTRLGNCIAWQSLIEGSWSALAKLETALGKLPSEVSVNWQRTEFEVSRDPRIPYHIWVSAADKPGILGQLLGFLLQMEARVEDMSGSVLPAPYTDLPTAKIALHVSLPADKPLSLLREEFSSFCERHNLYGIVEPFD